MDFKIKSITFFISLLLSTSLLAQENKISPSKEKFKKPLGTVTQKPLKAFDHTHKKWTELLKKYVVQNDKGTSSTVKYKSFNKESLASYLADLRDVTKTDFGSWSKEKQLAFYINAYNAFTVKLILDNYPLKSIRKISFFSPWKKEFFKLFGEPFFLDKIEHTLVRKSGKFKEARIHFAFNCASIGCPALLNTAWVHDKLEKQFDQAAKNFLKDRSRNKVNLKKKRIEVSNIFKWYGKDFEGNKNNYPSLKAFFVKYADSIGSNPKEVQFVKSKSFSVKTTGYNWNLNEAK